MYDLVIFDLDGTLIDSVGDIADALNRTLGELGLPPHSDAAVARMLGSGVRELVRRALGPERQTLLHRAVARYRAHYNQDPVRTATLAYDAVALVAALVKTQGPQRFSPQVLTNPSGFTGIDGLFRFRPDGTNERGLAVLRVSSSGVQIAAPPLRSFGGGSAT